MQNNEEKVERTFTKTGRPSHGWGLGFNRHGLSRSKDGTVYVKTNEEGTVRRAIPKVRGKAARRADKAARRA